MSYLLDVNTLIALAHTGHTLHAKAMDWFCAALSSGRSFHTCSITELGFVRISVSAGLQPDIDTAIQALNGLKQSPHHRMNFISDDVPAAQLPPFVKKSQQITDGHLLELATKNSMQLVTLDQHIPNALYIG